MTERIDPQIQWARDDRERGIRPAHEQRPQPLWRAWCPENVNCSSPGPLMSLATSRT